MESWVARSLIGLSLVGLAGSACAVGGSSQGESAAADGGSRVGQIDTDAGRDVDADRKDGPTGSVAGPIAIENLSYANDTHSTTVTFVVRNNSPLKSIGALRMLRVRFDATEVASWEYLSVCSLWQVAPGQASPIMRVSLYRLDNGVQTADVTCSPGHLSTGTSPSAAREATGKGPVSIEVTGLMADAAPFVANAGAPAFP